MHTLKQVYIHVVCVELYWLTLVQSLESCIQIVNFCIHHRASYFVFRIMLNVALLLRVVNEGEHVVVNQAVEEVNPSVEVGSNTCVTSQESDFSVNEGKPRMHTTLPCVL